MNEKRLGSGMKSIIEMRTIILLMTLIMTFTPLFGRSEEGDFFQNIGKMYVVVAVVMVTFIGIVIFLIFLERRIKKLEDSIKQ